MPEPPPDVPAPEGPASGVDWPAEYAATRRRLVELAAGLDDLDAAAAVPTCPDWTVKDVLAHVAGMAVALSRGEMPSGDVQTWIDDLVARRRERTVAEITAEWEAAADGVDGFVRAMGPGGGQLVYDLVAHEHDIRHALGRPGDRDTSAVVACAHAVATLLGRDLAAHGLPAVRITSGGRTFEVGDGEPGLAIELDPFELIRVFGSRRSEAQLRALPWRGDLDRYLPAIAHLPLPERDIVE